MSAPYPPYSQYPQYQYPPPPPPYQVHQRSGAITTAGVLLILESLALAGFGGLLLLLAAVSANESTGGMEDLGIAIAAGLAIIILPVGLLGIVLGWRLLRRGHIARIIAIVVSVLLAILAGLGTVSAATDQVTQQGPVVLSAAIALWYLLIALLLLTPGAARDVAATRAARGYGGR